MARPRGKNKANLNKIILTLSESREGLWIREIARRTKLKPMTVSYYASAYPDIFDDQTVQGPKKAVFRLIRLRPGALTKPGVILSKILKEHV